MKYEQANKALKNASSGLAEMEVKALLIAEAKRLKEIIRQVWGKYEASYSPSVYVRTHETENSLTAISITPVFVVDPITNTLGVRLNFPNSLYHMSLFQNNPKGHSFMLISTGWKSRKLEDRLGRRIDRFTYYGGYDLIGQIIEIYNATKPKGQHITIEFEWKGKTK